MELPLETEGRKTTHDFLSLYSSSAHTQQDSSYPQGEELFEKNVTRMKEDIKGVGDSVDHGGIGMYNISYLNLKTANSFTLWDESHPKMKETHILPEARVGMMLGRRSMPPSQSSSNHKHKATNFGCFSSSQPSSSEKNQTFMDMILTSAKSNLEEEEEEEEEEDDVEEEFNIKKEPSSHSKGNLSVKPEVKTIEHKPNTPRSKHSATEQRRRSKINDRFYKLREIIPNSDQKRDKASFLLEVIDYIQFLQEKVNRFENVLNQEPSTPMHWQRSCQGVSSDSGPAVFKNLVESTSLGVRVHHHPELTTSQMQPSIFSHGKMKKEVESGSINISSVYSQGLLNSLGQALQRSGVDLSQASISVQINLGKRRPLVVEDEVGGGGLPRARAGKDLGHAVKKLRSSSRQV